MEMKAANAQQPRDSLINIDQDYPLESDLPPHKKRHYQSNINIYSSNLDKQTDSKPGMLVYIDVSATALTMPIR